MMLKYAPIALMLPLLAGAAPPPDPVRNDVRCLIVTMSLINSSNEQLKRAGAIASQYFLGRIDGGAPGLDLEAAITRELPISAADNTTLLRSCGALMEKRGAEVKAIGVRLSAKGL